MQNPLRSQFEIESKPLLDLCFGGRVGCEDKFRIRTLRLVWPIRNERVTLLTLNIINIPYLLLLP